MKWKLKTIRLEFKPQDLWVGFFWRHRTYHDCQGYHVPDDLDLWICVVPMLPLHIRFIERI